MLWNAESGVKGTICPTARPSVRAGYAVLLGVLLYAGAATAQTPELVKDINTRATGTPDALTSFAGRIYYRVLTTPAAGLWRTDGTEDGTVRVHEGPVDSLTVAGDHLFFVGAADAGPLLWATDGGAAPAAIVSGNATDLINLGGALLFVLTREDGSWELWRSNGTVAGSMRLHTFPAPSIEPHYLTAAGDRIFFTGGDGSDELWTSDGTVDGTKRLLHRSSSYPGIYELTAVGDDLFFLSREAEGPKELWASDGTTARMITAFELGGEPHGLTAVGDLLYFTVYGVQVRLWRSDGTTDGTRALAPPLIYVLGLVGLDALAVFAAGDEGGSSYWVSDGSDAGTHRIDGPVPGPSAITQWTKLGDALLVVDHDGSNPGLWRTDGSAEGTARLAQGAVASISRVEVGGMILFSVGDAGETTELWRTDGTAAGTSPVPASFAGPPELSGAAASLEELYFVADDGTGAEVWRSDATEAGTSGISDVLHATDSSLPSSMTSLDGLLLFFADDGVIGSEPWRSDGTEAGTVVVGDIGEGEIGSLPPVTSLPIRLSRSVLFWANDQAYGVELWRTDGTAAGTRLVRDIAPGPGSSLIRPFGGPYRPQAVVMNDNVFFRARSDADVGLWKSDGSEEGTVRVGTVTNSIAEPAVLDRMLYFTATDGVSGYELWRTDGSDQGTVRVADIAPGAANSGPDFLLPVNGGVYFYADDGEVGRQLWRTDGTEAGTLRLTDDANETPSYDETEVGGAVYFTTRVEAIDRRTLWKSDGTREGTVRVRTLPSELVVPKGVNGTLLFGASEAGVLRPWRSDGTAPGTAPLSDTVSGLAAGFQLVSNFEPVAGGVGFLVADESLRFSLWRSDGSSAGTVRVRELDTWPFSTILTRERGVLFFPVGATVWRSDGTEAGTVPLATALNAQPGSFKAAGSRVFFAADDGERGVELWATAAPCAGDCTGDREVSDEDLALGVRRALGEVAAGVCDALDTSGDQRVTVEELIVAVGEKGTAVCRQGG